MTHAKAQQPEHGVGRNTRPRTHGGLHGQADEQPSASQIMRLQRDAGNSAATLAVQRWQSVAEQLWDIETIGGPPKHWKLSQGDGLRFEATTETPALVADALTNLTSKKSVNKFIADYRAGKIKDTDAAPDRTPKVVAPPVRPDFPAHNLKGSFYADPAMIRYSQDSIAGTFTNGTPLIDVADDLRARRIRADKFPPIQIIQLRTKNGAFLFVSVDNRRLWVFRTAGRQIRCQWIHGLNANDTLKMTGGTGNYGTENIKVRDY